MANLILASASPRRRELLHLITPSYDLASSSAAEQIHISKETPVRKVPLLLAAAKARDVAEKNPGKVVIGADTVVIDPEGEILGKPLDEADAAHMLRLLSGKTHQVVTGVCLYYQPPKPSLPEKSSPLSESFAEITDVTFYPLSEEEIKDYVATGEPMDKAGAYALQGYASLWITHMEGSYSSVIGLPLYLVRKLLLSSGYPLPYFS